MAEGHITVQLLTNNQAGADSLKAAIDTYLTNNPPLRVDTPPTVVPGHGSRTGIPDWDVIADVVFATQQRTQNLFNSVQTQWSTGPQAANVKQGSIVQWWWGEPGEAPVIPASQRATKP